MPAQSSAWQRHVVRILIAIAALCSANAALAQPAEPAMLYAGEGRLGSEPPFPVHLELRRSGSVVEGVIRSPGSTFLLSGSGTDVVTGTVAGDQARGTVSFQIVDGMVRGTFELGGQEGTFEAVETSLDAQAYFRGPEQRLDLTTAEWREDLDRLVAILTEEHGSPFHRTGREAFLAAVQDLRSALPGLDGAQVAIEFIKLAAMIGDGHTGVSFPSGRPRYPFTLFWFEDGLRVTGMPPVHQAHLGSRLVEIEGVPIRIVVERLRAFAGQGETEWGYRSAAPYFAGSFDVLENLGIGSGTSRTFTFERTSGETETVTLPATVETPDRLLLGGGLPLWDRGSEAFDVQRLPDGTVYVNWRGYDHVESNAAALLGDLDRQRPKRLVLDLRDNGGGDFNRGREFIGEITARAWLNRPDRLFVLIGRRTFSAAMTNAVDFRRTTHATLVGEPAGAAPNNWQEVRTFFLPNSGLRVGVSTRFYEFLPGEQALRPDLHIPPTPSDWGAAHDAALRYVLASPCAG